MPSPPPPYLPPLKEFKVLEHNCDGCKSQGLRFVRGGGLVTVFCNKHYRLVNDDYDCLEKEEKQDANCSDRTDTDR